MNTPTFEPCRTRLQSMPHMFMRSSRFLRDLGSGLCEYRSILDFFLFDACDEKEGKVREHYTALPKIIVQPGFGLG